MLRSLSHAGIIITSWDHLLSHWDHYNNNEYLERPTRTGPKRLHVLYKYKIQCIQHGCARAHTHTHTHTHTHKHARPTRTGPKRLHVLYKYKIQCIQHGCAHTHTHTRTHARTHARTHTHTHTHQSHIRAIREMRLKKRFLKRERFSRKI